MILWAREAPARLAHPSKPMKSVGILTFLACGKHPRKFVPHAMHNQANITVYAHALMHINPSFPKSKNIIRSCANIM